MQEEQEYAREDKVIRVLLVEDNETDYILTRELLEKVRPGQFDLHWVSSYYEGLSCLCSNGYDVCLLDLRLGAHSGLDILLEANESGCTVPTILLTGFDTPEIDGQALRARAADYLVKTDLNGRDLVRAIFYAMERSRAAQSIKRSQQFVQSTLDSLSSHIAVLDEKGSIVAVNRAWRIYAQQNGCIRADYGIGINYLNVCEAASGPEAHDARRVGDGIRAVMSGQVPKFYLEYPCPSPQQHRWFSVRVTRFDWDGPPHVVVAHEDVTHRREAEAAMRASEARFRAAAEGSLDSFFIMEGVRNADNSLYDLRVVYTNARGAALLNKSSDEILGHLLRNLVPTHHIQGFIESCAHVIESRLTVEGTNRVRIPAVHADWLHFQIVPLDDGVAVTIKDISEEKHSLEALQKREQQLSEAQQIAHLGSWDVDVETHIATWSDESYRIYGLEPQSEELTVARVYDLIHPDDREMVQEIVGRAKQNKENFLLQHRLVRPDGALRIVESRAEMILDEHGTPIRVVGTMRDVTEQVQSERALRESQEQLQTIITSVDMVIWSLDRNGIVTMSEGKGLVTAGLQPGEVVGHSIFELYPEGAPSAAAARRALSGENVSITLESNGIFWETRYSPLRDSNGEIIGATGVAIDITERLKSRTSASQIEPASTHHLGEHGRCIFGFGP
jgi:PAS domain S-box-containing protein